MKRAIPALLAFAAGFAVADVAQAASFSTNFDTANGGAPVLNATDAQLAPSGFRTVAGSVDLIGNGSFDAYPGRGLYLDTAGST